MTIRSTLDKLAEPGMLVASFGALASSTGDMDVLPWVMLGGFVLIVLLLSLHVWSNRQNIKESQEYRRETGLVREAIADLRIAVVNNTAATEKIVGGLLNATNKHMTESLLGHERIEEQVKQAIKFLTDNQTLLVQAVAELTRARKETS